MRHDRLLWCRSRRALDPAARSPSRRRRTLAALGAALLPLTLALVLPACSTVCTGGIDYAPIPAPVLTVADGVVYAETDGTVSALRIDTGVLLWHTRDSLIATSRVNRPLPPVVTDDVVLFSTGPGTLSAFRRADGALRWHSQPVPHPQQRAETPWPSQILIATAGVVYGAASTGSLAAWRLTDGALLWQSAPLAVPADPSYAAEGLDSLPLPQPVVGGDVVYFSAGPSVHAVNAADGTLLWSSPALQAENLYTPPVLANGRLFLVAYDNSVYALRADSGAVLWHAPAGAPAVAGASSPATATANPGQYPAPIPAPPVVQGGVVYYTAVEGMWAVAADTGALLWQQDYHTLHQSPPPQYFGTESGPVVSGGVVYAVLFGGGIWALDARTGAFRWANGGQDSGMPFFVADDSVYTVSGDGVGAVRSADGMRRWRSPPGFVNTAPRIGQAAFADGAIYFSSGGTVTCAKPDILPTLTVLRATDGALLWHTAVPVS